MLMNFHFWKKVNKEKIRACKAILNHSCVRKCYKYPQKRCWEPCPCLENMARRRAVPGTQNSNSLEIQWQTHCERKCKVQKVVWNLPSAMQIYTIYWIHNGGSKTEGTQKTTNEVPSQSILSVASWIQYRQGMWISKGAQSNLDAAEGNFAQISL